MIRPGRRGARHSRLQPRLRRAWWGVLLGIVLAAGLAAADATVTPRSVTILGLLATVPFVAAAASTVVGTVAAGAVAAATAVLMSDYAHATGSRGALAVVAGVAAATVVAALTAWLSGRRLRQLHHSRSVAEVVQQTLLRPMASDLGGVTIAAQYSSATRGANVGGDVYDVLGTPYGLRAFLGDVRGKGLPAIHLASDALGAFREWAYQLPDLRDLALQLDVSIARNAEPEDFVTGVLVEVGAGTLDVVNCGHPTPFVLTADTAVAVEPAEPSLPFGLGVTPLVRRVAFNEGDALLLYTDGVSDARRRRRYFDLGAEVSRLAGLGPDELVHALHRRLLKFTRRRLGDDVAILVLRNDRPVVPASLTLLEQDDRSGVRG